MRGFFFRPIGDERELPAASFVSCSTVLSFLVAFSSGLTEDRLGDLATDSFGSGTTRTPQIDVSFNRWVSRISFIVRCLTG